MELAIVIGLLVFMIVFLALSYIVIYAIIAGVAEEEAEANDCFPIEMDD